MAGSQEVKIKERSGRDSGWFRDLVLVPIDLGLKMPQRSNEIETEAMRHINYRVKIIYDFISIVELILFYTVDFIQFEPNIINHVHTGLNGRRRPFTDGLSVHSSTNGQTGTRIPFIEACFTVEYRHSAYQILHVVFFSNSTCGKSQNLIISTTLADFS